jgi:hypothetical protein
MVDAGVDGVSGRSVVAVSSSFQQHAILGVQGAYQAHGGGTQH